MAAVTGRSEKTLPACPSRHPDNWCFRPLNDRRYAGEGILRPEGGEVAHAMPLTKTDILALVARSGRPAADLLCRAFNDLPCPYRPRYDSVHRKLFLGDEELRQFFRKAENQMPILEAFEAAGWPPRIENPLSRAKKLEPERRLSDAVKALNKRQKRKRVHFWVEKGTQDVCWELIDDGSVRRRGLAGPSAE